MLQVYPYRTTKEWSDKGQESEFKSKVHAIRKHALRRPTEPKLQIHHLQYLIYKGMYAGPTQNTISNNQKLLVLGMNTGSTSAQAYYMQPMWRDIDEQRASSAGMT